MQHRNIGRDIGQFDVSIASRALIILCLGLDLCIGGIPGNWAHADSSESPRTAGERAFWEELAFWETIKNSNDPAEFEAYLSAFPEGRFARLAEIRVRKLKVQGESDSAEETDGSAPDGSDVSEGTATGSEADAYDQSAGTAPGAAATSTGSEFQDCDDCPRMVVVPAGDYLMGSDRHRPDEKPRHAVTFTRPFAIGMHEVTIREWNACVREGDCSFSPKANGDDSLPVGNLSWVDAQRYLAWLSRKTGNPYRLPTEAEWEYAASGGRASKFWWGDEAGKANANCRDCGSSRDGQGATAVASFAPNPFGLYDVHGNLWEWTMDCVNRSYKGAPTDGSAWLRGDCLARVLRGGSWNLDSDYMRTTRRHHYDRDVRYYLHGLRVVRSLP
jgi:formylglycine-generating enzyme required for sulfatase activity